MSEQKFDFVTDKLDHIRAALPGIYFLIQDDKVVHIGESNDIKKTILKHIKKGKEFNKVGIQLFDGNKNQRKKHTRELIQAAKSGGQVPDRPQNPKTEKIRQKQEKPRKRQARKSRKQTRPAKEVSLPPDRLEQIRSSSNNGSVKLSPATTEQINQLADQGLGARTEIVELAVQQLYKEKLEKQARSGNHHKPKNPDPKDGQGISPEAKDALAEWTRKVTQEAMSEISAELENIDPTEAPPDLPNWLYELADEPIENQLPAERESKLEDHQHIDDSLPSWAQTDFQPSPDQLQTPVRQFKPEPRESDDEEIPEWLKDVDYKKPGGNSLPPFG